MAGLGLAKRAFRCSEAKVGVDSDGGKPGMASLDGLLVS